MALDTTPLTYEDRVETIVWIGDHINWGFIQAAIIIAGLILIYKASKKSKILGKMGMNTNNLILMGNLKNILNSYQDEKQQIYRELYHDLIMADSEEEEIFHLNTAIEKLKKYKEDNTNGRV